MTTSLIHLSGWDAPVLAQDVLARQAELRALCALFNHPITTQEQADEVAQLIGECERWEADLEEASAACRKPYFDHGKKIKSCTDSCLWVVIEARKPVQNHLADWEAEKLRTKRQLEQQAREAAERERAELEARARTERDPERREELRSQAESVVPAPVTWESPKTEGVRSGVALEWDVVDERAFAEWCWANGKEHWVRRIEFDKRNVSEEMARVPDAAPVPEIPGLAIRRVAAVRVAKAKKEKVRDVATTSVAL